MATTPEFAAVTDNGAEAPKPPFPHATTEPSDLIAAKA
jgi:hypothetical protein